MSSWWTIRRDRGPGDPEDIVEELVGEIWDEHDEVIEEFKKQADGSYLISCSADLTDLFDLFPSRTSATPTPSPAGSWSR